MDIAEYRRLRGEAVGFQDFLRAEPLVDAEVDVVCPRDAA